MDAVRRRALQGACLGIGAPAGWLIIRWLGGHSPLRELADYPGLYAYLLLPTSFVLSAFGALLGGRENRLRNANSLLEELTVTDPLTKLKNVRYFRARLEEEVGSAVRDETPLALLVMDLDRFKRVNDRYGHGAGDRVLAAVGSALSSVARRGETVARIGGEEFALILPQASIAEAVSAGERVREAVKQITVPSPRAGPIRLTISVGAASGEADAALDADLLFAAADRALYAAKRGGRDRVVSEAAVGPDVPLASSLYGSQHGAAARTEDGRPHRDGDDARIRARPQHPLAADRGSLP